MTMRMRVGCVAVLAFLWSAPSADAATKLCFFKRRPAGAWLFDATRAIDVPENPTFVIDRGRLRDDFRVEVARRGEDGTVLTRSAEISIAPLDEQNSVVTVLATEGDFIPDPGFVGHGLCSASRAFRVVRDWRATKAMPDVVAQGDDLLLRRPSDGEALSWTSLEWAYSHEALTADLHESEGFAPYLWDHPAPGTAIFLRLVRLWPDGTRVAVRRSVTGSAPATVACEEPRPPRAIPPGAEFLVEGRYAAFATDGRRLPLRADRDADTGHMRVSVDAPAGTTFALHALPIVSECPAAQPLVVTDDRWREERPTVTGVFPVAEMMDQPARWPDFPIELRIAHADTWGLVEVAWGATYGEMESADDDHRDRVPADWMYFFQPRLPAGLQVMYVRVTPLWGAGGRGAPWTGRLTVDPFTRIVDLQTIAPPAPAEPRCGTRTGTARVAGDTMTLVRRAAPYALAALLLLVLWGALRARRNRHTSAPPPG